MHRRRSVTFGEATAQTLASPSASHDKMQNSLNFSEVWESQEYLRWVCTFQEVCQGLFFQLLAWIEHVPSLIAGRVK